MAEHFKMALAVGDYDPEVVASYLPANYKVVELGYNLMVVGYEEAGWTWTTTSSRGWRAGSTSSRRSSDDDNSGDKLLSLGQTLTMNECSNGHPLRWFRGPECPDCGREADTWEEEWPTPDECEAAGELDT